LYFIFDRDFCLIFGGVFKILKNWSLAGPRKILPHGFVVNPIFIFGQGGPNVRVFNG